MLSWTQRANYQLCKLRRWQAWIPCSSLLGRSRGQEKLGWEGEQKAWEKESGELPKALCTQNYTVSLYPLQLQTATKNQPQLWKNSTLCLQVDQAFTWPLTLAVSVALVGSSQFLWAP